MSLASSGGVTSSARRTAFTIFWNDSWSASRTPEESTITVRGRPETRSRPFTAMVSSSSSGSALPICILISSAVGSPIRTL